MQVDIFYNNGVNIVMFKMLLVKYNLLYYKQEQIYQLHIQERHAYHQLRILWSALNQAEKIQLLKIFLRFSKTDYIQISNVTFTIVDPQF